MAFIPALHIRSLNESVSDGSDRLPEELNTQLISEAKNGSNYALAQLLQENYSKVFGYLLKLTLDSQLAADITQDCMLKVIDKVELYDPRLSSFSTWMISIAKHLWLEDCRRNRRRQKYSEQYVEAPVPDPVEQFPEKDEILAALDKMSQKSRMPILLKYSGGYSYEEIADLLKIPLGTVKSRISNGIAFLRKELESHA